MTKRKLTLEDKVLAYRNIQAEKFAPGGFDKELHAAKIAGFFAGFDAALELGKAIGRAEAYEDLATAWFAAQGSYSYYSGRKAKAERERVEKMMGEE